jgi:3-deoxy-manno-octulosonate cytidylyltransferase (CMP-KDO synthetase)
MLNFMDYSSKSVRILGIIPARYASSRFPGKPLVVINGKSMIQRVHEQASKCPELSSVIIATDNESIEKHVKSFGGKVMMTSVHHKSGTERCSEVIERITADGQESFDAVINIQGDEPFIDPGQISKLAAAIMNPEIRLATLIKKIVSQDELTNPNVVKVIFNRDSQAIYFSRYALPYFRGKEMNEWLGVRDYFKHIGIYAYRSDVLGEIVKLPVSSLEQAESLEQLRWIENGYKIHVFETDTESISVDTPSDLLKITNMP